MPIPVVTEVWGFSGRPLKHGCRSCRKGKVDVEIAGIAIFDTTVGPHEMVVYECQVCGALGHQYWGEIVPSLRSGWGRS